jgi:VanZ family protein
VRWRWLLAVAVVVQIVVLYFPLSGPDASVTLVPGLDKLVHAAVFGAEAFTGRRAGVPLLPLVALLVAHAVLSEVIQGTLLPARDGDPYDAVADVVGTALGAWLAGVVDRKGSEPLAGGADRGR